MEIVILSPDISKLEIIVGWKKEKELTECTGGLDLRSYRLVASNGEPR